MFTTSANNIDVHGCSALIFNDRAIKVFVDEIMSVQYEKVTEQPYDISAFNFQFLSITFLSFTHPGKIESLIVEKVRLIV